MPKSRSVTNYAAPVWSPLLSDTQYRNIQSCQNAALRMVTGCIQMSSIQHLNEETKILPVKEHNEMLSKQLLLGCHRGHHSNFNITQLELTPRHVRKDLRIYKRSILRYVHDLPNRDSYIADLKRRYKFHGFKLPYECRTMSRPPPIADLERKLPRSTRVVLTIGRNVGRIGPGGRVPPYKANIDYRISKELLCESS